jgi:hypothetical protein
MTQRSICSEGKREVNEKVLVRSSQVVKWGREEHEQQVARKVDIRI